MTDIFYHTQEKRDKKLTQPIKCTRDDAWFGTAYYFWKSEEDAIFWGNNSKKNTGYFEIYKSTIKIDNVLNTVFNQEHYEFWLKQIEKVAKKITQKSLLKPTIKELNDYFVEKGIWTQFDGMIFQDISNNPIHFMVQKFQYKKRIQLALYNKQKIINFTHHYENMCI